MCFHFLAKKKKAKKDQHNKHACFHLQAEVIGYSCPEKQQRFFLAPPREKRRGAPSPSKDKGAEQCLYALPLSRQPTRDNDDVMLFSFFAGCRPKYSKVSSNNDGYVTTQRSCSAARLQVDNPSFPAESRNGGGRGGIDRETNSSPELHQANKREHKCTSSLLVLLLLPLLPLMLLL